MTTNDMKVFTTGVSDEILSENPVKQQHTESNQKVENDSNASKKTERYLDYCNDNMSEQQKLMVEKAYNLGEDYAKQITSVALTDEEMQCILLGYKSNLNVFHEVMSGEDISKLSLLVKASTYDDFVLNKFFINKGATLSYEKLVNYLKNKK